MRRLFVAAHADDEVIGAGGTMAVRAAAGDEVMVGVLSVDADPDADQIRRAEATAAWSLLSVHAGAFAGLPCRPLLGDAAAVRAVCGWLDTWEPDVLYLPHPGESDPDHQVVTQIVRNALLRAGRGCPLFGYEVWTPLTTYHLISDVSAVVELKRRAIAAYRSQVARWAWDEAALGLNRYRGVTSGRGRWCEAFEVVPL